MGLYVNTVGVPLYVRLIVLAIGKILEPWTDKNQAHSLQLSVPLPMVLPMNPQEKRLLEILQDNLSDNSMFTTFAAAEISKHRRAVQELFIVLAISHLQELSRLYKSGKCPARLKKLGKFAFDYERTVLEGAGFARQIDFKAQERLMEILDGTEKKNTPLRVIASVEYQIENSEIELDLEEDGVSLEDDGGNRIREIATEVFEYWLEEEMQSIRIVGL